MVTTEENGMEVSEFQGQVTNNTAASASLFEGSQPYETVKQFCGEIHVVRNLGLCQQREQATLKVDTVTLVDTLNAA